MTDSEDQTDIDDESLETNALTQALAVVSTYKVLGELDDGSGAGVLGKNLASNGTPIGVQGAVPNNSSGFGLATPDDARIEGDFESTSGHTLTIAGTDTLRINPPGSDGRDNAAGASIVGGYPANTVNGAVGATVGGGGRDTGENVVLDDYGTIGGGYGNQAGVANASGTDNAVRATVGGGDTNIASGTGSTVGGGSINTATSGSDYATISGGTSNSTKAVMATVGGGDSNVASGNRSTIGGGQLNTASTFYATVGGGIRNTASGYYSTVPGGKDNVATRDHTFAAGRQAEAKHAGTYVWADSTSGTVTSTASNQYIVQAGGGVGVNTTSPDAPLDISGGNFDLTNTEGDLKIGDGSHRLKFGIATSGGGAGDTHIRTESTNLNKLSIGVGSNDVLVVNSGSVFPASDDTYSLGKSGNRWSEVWSANGTIQTSDARLKTNISDLGGGLEQVRAMRPVTYEWTPDDGADQDPTDGQVADADEARIGLIAQEVAEIVPEAVVESGDDGPLGLAYDMLIPVLIDAVNEQQETIEELRAENESLHERLATVESHLGIGAEGTPSAADD
jgi:hypothetical protein